jgi:hypothetical protein
VLSRLKGFEDSALCAYNRLVSLNEVGGDPASASGLLVGASCAVCLILTLRRVVTTASTSSA